jgi:serine/threonine protein kinase
VIKGGDLFFHLTERMTNSKKKHAFTENEARIILAETYLGIEHLHQHGYIHCDIKIENIMLDVNGHVKIVDFGLATRIISQVQPMSAVGSLIYMAPELLIKLGVDILIGGHMVF